MSSVIKIKWLNMIAATDTFSSTQREKKRNAWPSHILPIMPNPTPTPPHK